LVVAGDFDKTKTKEWIQKYFGPIPKGEVVKNKLLLKNLSTEQ
jgi:zinc protease